MAAEPDQLLTPDRRYIVVDGRLWRSSNPALGEERRQSLVDQLMDARRNVSRAEKGSAEMIAARKRVNEAKVALGERGAVWWDDDSPDLNRRLVKNTPYADWHAAAAGGNKP